MKWLVFSLTLVLHELYGVSSTSANQNQTFSQDDSELNHLDDSIHVRSNISADASTSDLQRGHKPQFKMHRDVLSLDQILTRKVDLPSLRVYNGDPATLGKIPFIVRIYIFKFGYRYLCGGSILSENWVVTAAHCIMDKAQYGGTNHSITIHGPNIQVIAGDVSTNEYESSTVVKTVTQVYTHENYNPRYLQSDIALLFIKDGFNLTSPNVKKINMANTPPDTGSKVTIAGWGRQENEEIATVLQYTTYSVPDQTFCKRTFSRKGYYVLPGMLCTGDDQMKAHSAMGDSGGPVFIESGQDNFTLFGLVSWGVQKDVGTYDYDINADIAYYRQWVLNIMDSYKQYRMELFAEINTKTMSWQSGTDVLRYQVFNISCETGRAIKVVFTALTLSRDYTHVIARDGDQFNSKLLLQHHDDLTDSQTLSATSSSNKLLILVRTTVSQNKKLVRFVYSSVSNTTTSTDTPDPCKGNLTECTNKWECYDTQFKCDGDIADCSDWSDEQDCGSSSSGDSGVLWAVLGLLAVLAT